MLKLFSRLLDSNQRELKKLEPIVAKINSLEEKATKLKGEEFPAKTASFRQRLTGGETLDNLLPEAFALAREAIKRVINERAYDVQLMAAISLHQGQVAEQKTGEGKTLSAAIAAYLNALAGEGVHIVTVNDYLARRDTGWYGRALKFLGLSIGCIMHDQSFLLDPDFVSQGQFDERLRHLRPTERKSAYLADVTYGTNNEFGFDYLRDNMAYAAERIAQRQPHFAIVDEVDFVLIDEARTPLIISAPDREPTSKYYEATQMISILSPDTDYTIDEKLKTATLTEHGLRKVEKRLGVDNLYEKDFDTIHHLENALRARTLYKKDRDYVVKDNQVIIVDEFTGRLMHGRRWSDGLHQSVEAKEGVKIEQESKTMATISFQNYFRMYKKLSGMTGTAVTEAEEFEKIYSLKTVVVPTNLPMVRADGADLVYKTTRAKFAAITREVEEKFKKGQPVLVGTTSIEKNQIIDKFLDKIGVPHQVLNAKNHEREALIIADAGKKKAVTVATNLAGRGVDIVLGGARPENPTEKEKKGWQKDHDEILSLGGLHVIGTERHESRRIDNQLRGRAGRQGDPGSSRFYVALDDDIMRLFGGEKIARVMTALKIPEDQPIEHGMVSKAIEQAQVRVESFHFDMRKRVVEYDDVMNRQREIIYGRRRLSLSKETSLKENLLERMRKEVADLVSMYAPEGFAKTELAQIVTGFCEILPLETESQQKLKKVLAKKDSLGIKKSLTETLLSAYESRETQLGEENMRQIERVLALMTLDRLWVGHLDSMDSLREGIGLRGYGQQDPLVEYKKEAYSAFEALLQTIDANVVRRVFRVQVNQAPAAIRPAQTVEGRGQLPTPQPTAHPEPSRRAHPEPSQRTQPSSQIRPVVSGQPKIGRNDPCPCGAINPNTGRAYKYKKCGLISAPHHQG
jgi:preprotein translocase subunit SecA